MFTITNGFTYIAFLMMLAGALRKEVGEILGKVCKMEDL